MRHFFSMAPCSSFATSRTWERTAALSPCARRAHRDATYANYASFQPVSRELACNSGVTRNSSFFYGGPAERLRLLRRLRFDSRLALNASANQVHYAAVAHGPAKR